MLEWNGVIQSRKPVELRRVDYINAVICTINTDVAGNDCKRRLLISFSTPYSSVLSFIRNLGIGINLWSFDCIVIVYTVLPTRSRTNNFFKFAYIVFVVGYLSLIFDQVDYRGSSRIATRQCHFKTYRHVLYHVCS